jgi:hypothetical protein
MRRWQGCKQVLELRSCASLPSTQQRLQKCLSGEREEKWQLSKQLSSEPRQRLQSCALNNLSPQQEAHSHCATFFCFCSVWHFFKAKKTGRCSIAEVSFVSRLPRFHFCRLARDMRVLAPKIHELTPQKGTFARPLSCCSDALPRLCLLPLNAPARNLFSGPSFLYACWARIDGGKRVKLACSVTSCGS